MSFREISRFSGLALKTVAIAVTSLEKRGAIVWHNRGGSGPALPVLDDQPRVRKRSKLVLVEAFIAKAAVERLDVGVLCRLGRGK